MFRRQWRSFDFVQAAVLVLLLIYGVAMVASATRGTEDMADLWQRQALYALSGLVIMVLVAAFDYRFYENLHRALYAFTILALILVFVLGEISQGVQRWLGTNAVQPSELAKVVIIIGLAKLMADRDGEMNRMRNVLLTLLYVVVPMVLVYMQPNLSTSLTLGMIWVVMVLMAGGRLVHLFLLAMTGALVSPLIWLTLKEYMRQRVLLFLNPEGSPDSFYNVQQALISIGTGGWLGKGFGSGTQSQLRFLRVRHTDYIFSVIGEELGLLGVVVLLLLLGLLLWRILRVAERAKDPFGRLLCIGVAGIVLLQAVINVSVNLGILPVTGLPLPFVSYGGSSLWTFMVALGLVQSAAMRRKKLDFE